MDIFQGLINGLGIFLCLTVAVTVHEAGHYLAARWAKVDVEAFAIGWGKILWSWKPGTTEFRLCLFPLGGYCKMKGDQDLLNAIADPNGTFSPSPRSIFAAPAWKRIIISAAGPLVNLVFAFCLFFALFTFGYTEVGQEPRIQLASEVDGRTGTAAERAGLQTGDIIKTIGTQPITTFQDVQQAILEGGSTLQAWTYSRGGVVGKATVQPTVGTGSSHPIVGIYPFYKPLVDTVAPGSVSYLAGFKPGDTITTIDGNAITTGAQFFAVLERNPRQNHTIQVTRGSSTFDLLLVPDDDIKKDGWGLSFLIPNFTIPGLAPDQAVSKGWTKTSDLFKGMVAGLIELCTGQSNPLQSLSGPIGIVKSGSEATSTAFSRSSELGWTTVVQFTAFLNIALVLMNLLPIPALDGGSIIISLIEGIRRKRFGIKALIRYQQIGALFVLCLIIFTTANDLGLFGK